MGAWNPRDDPHIKPALRIFFDDGGELTEHDPSIPEDGGKINTPARGPRRILRSAALIAAALIYARDARAQAFASAADATAAGEFLQLGVGARAVAMGGAFSAVADDATALYWNPAGLSRIPSSEATFMHAPYIASSYFDYAAYVHNFGRAGAVGVGSQYFSAGGLTQTDQTGTIIGTANPYDLAASAGYSHDIPGSVPVFGGGSAGLAAAFIQSKILDTAQTEAVNLGFLSRPYRYRYYGHSELRWAFVASNLGPPLNYGDLPESLPTTLTAGAALRLPWGELVSLDLNAPQDGRPYPAVGTEYPLAIKDDWRMALRAGYDSETLGSIDGVTGATAGLGLGYKGLSVDYAFVPYGGLGMTQRISLSYAWGGPGAPPRRNRPADWREEVRHRAEQGDRELKSGN